MAIIDLFESNDYHNNVAHFAAIVNVAKVDGLINQNEKVTISDFAKKLGITDDVYKEIMNNSEKYPIIPQSNAEKRLEYIFDLIKIIASDHFINETEQKIIFKYAIALGMPIEKAKELIAKSIKIFNGDFDFETYKKILTVV